MPKIVAVANQKGGVGKTTTSVNLSSCVAFRGKKVLLIDLDPQGNTTTGLGIDKKTLEKSTYDAIINEEPAEDIIIPTCQENLFLMPASVKLAGAEIELVSRMSREHRLETAIEDVKDNYDYIFIDCPPSLGLLTLNALAAANAVLVPIQCEYYALEGLSQLMNTARRIKRMYNPYLDIEGVLLTMFDGRLNLTQQVVNEVKRFFPKKVYSTTIPRNVRLSEAPSFGQPIMYFDKNSKGSIAYSALCDEFLSQQK